MEVVAWLAVVAGIVIAAVLVERWLRLMRIYAPALPPAEEAVVIDGVVALLESDPEGWTESRHTLDHAGRGIEIWLANHPYADMDLHKPSLHVSYRGANRLRKAVARRAARSVTRMLAGPTA